MNIYLIIAAALLLLILAGFGLVLISGGKDRAIGQLRATLRVVDRKGMPMRALPLRLMCGQSKMRYDYEGDVLRTDGAGEVSLRASLNWARSLWSGLSPPEVAIGVELTFDQNDPHRLVHRFALIRKRFGGYQLIHEANKLGIAHRFNNPLIEPVEDPDYVDWSFVRDKGPDPDWLLDMIVSGPELERLVAR